MPAKNQKADRNSNWRDTHFVGLKLTESDKQRFKTWWEERIADVEELVNVEIARGHKFSVTFDKNNQCVIVSMTCVDDDDVNNGCCISSRSDNWVEAVGLCIYKSNVLLADTAWRNVSSRDTWG